MTPMPAMTPMPLALAAWLAISAVLFVPRPWQIHHPRKALSLWWVLMVTAHALLWLTLGQLVFASVDPAWFGQPWVQMSGWGVLFALGAGWSWVVNRASELTVVDHRARSTIGQLRDAAAYRSEMRDRFRVTYVSSDQPTAWTHPYRREVFLTSALVAHASTSQLDAVIAHEQHHVQARHPLTLRISRLHAACLPFPGVAAVHRRVRLLTELAADDHAVGQCGLDATVGALDLIASLTDNDAAALRAFRLRVRGGMWGSSSSDPVGAGESDLIQSPRR